MKNKGGRPLKINQTVLQKLEQAFAYSYSDDEACLYAGIVPATLYTYQKRNPKFKERKEALKKSPNLVAKKVLVEGIQDDIEQARWWALHKMSDEFSPKTKVEHEGSVEMVNPDLSTETISKAVEAFKTILRQSAAELNGKTL